METRRWTNPSLPQTLQIAVLLLYIEAFFIALAGALFSPIGILLIAGAVAAGFGIANEKRWGYILGLVLAVFFLLPFLFVLRDDGLGGMLRIGVLLQLAFPLAQFALLIHPMSREYQRVWFN